MKTVERNIDDLIPSEYNPRYLSEVAAEHLSASLKRFGAVDPAIINIHPDRKNIIIGGHQRIKVAKTLGWKTFPCVEIKLDRDKERELNIRLNKNTGAWDWDELSSHFDVTELTEWGFDEDELFGNFETEEPEAEEDDYEIPEEIQTDFVLGDLIEIGEHRLLCGDSTDSDQVAKLMDGKKADMVFTDPPYGLGLDKENQKIGKSDSYGSVKNDHSNQAAKDFYVLAKSLEIDILFFWGANHYSDILPSSPCWIVWDKQGGKHVTYADIELCYTNLNKPARMFTHIWDGFRRDSEKGEKRVHINQKPVKLISGIISFFDIEPKTILDGFLGSGSTMVACHQLNRKCYGMELDPKYCQVIVDRMLNSFPELEVKVNGKPYHKK